MALYDTEDDYLLGPDAYLTLQQGQMGGLRAPKPRRALASTPSMGVEAPAPSPRADPRAPTATPDYRGMALATMREAADASPSDEDRRAVSDYARRRHEGASNDFLAGMALSALGGESFAPIGGQVLKSALAAREPMKFAGGVVADGVFTPDPETGAQRRAQRLEAQAKIYESMAAHGESTEQRRTAAEAANALRLEIARMQDETRRMMAAAVGGRAADRAAERVEARARGRALPAHEVGKITEDEGKVAQFGNLLSSWKPEYGGLGTSIGNLSGKYNPLAGDDQRAQSQWWQGYQAFVNEMRHGQFGAALTPQEKAEFEKAIVTANTDPRNVATFLESQYQLAERARARRVQNLGRAGFDVSGFGGASAAPAYDPGKPMGPRNVPPVNLPHGGANVVDFGSLK